MKKVVICIVVVVAIIAIVLCAVLLNREDEEDETEEIVEETEEVAETQDEDDVTVFLNDLAALSENEVVLNAEAQMAEPEEGDTIAIFHVEDYGDMTIKFFEDVAPLACENFITHAEEGYYDGLTFHRIIEEFMIQGGDPAGNGSGGETIWGEDIGEELSASVLPYRGALCMASRGTGTKSIGSQFFIVTKNYDEDYDSYLSLYGYDNILKAKETYGGSLFTLAISYQYTTFGQVIDGFDVLDEISEVETDSNDKPIEDVVISSIDITTYTK